MTLRSSGKEMREAGAGSHLSEVNTSSQTGFYIERTNLVPAVPPTLQVLSKVGFVGGHPRPRKHKSALFITAPLRPVSGSLRVASKTLHRGVTTTPPMVFSVHAWSIEDKIQKRVDKITL